MSAVGVSLKPEDAQAGGGILEAMNGEKATISKCRFCLWDYGNPQYGEGLFLNVVYDLTNGEGQFDQKYSAGKSKNLVPANDGRNARPVDENGKTGLPEGCNALIWLTEARNAGFPDHLITNDASVFEGTEVELVVKPQPKRAGLEKEDGKGQKDILVIGKILNLPGGSVAGATPMKGKKKAVTQVASPVAVAKESAAAANAEAIHSRAIEVVMAVLSEKGGSCPKVAIAHSAFKIMEKEKDPLRNDVSKLVFKDEFLSGEDVPWSFDGTTVSL